MDGCRPQLSFPVPLPCFEKEDGLKLQFCVSALEAWGRRLQFSHAHPPSPRPPGLRPSVGAAFSPGAPTVGNVAQLRFHLSPLPGSPVSTTAPPKLTECLDFIKDWGNPRRSDTGTEKTSGYVLNMNSSYYLWATGYLENRFWGRQENSYT